MTEDQPRTEPVVTVRRIGPADVEAYRRTRLRALELAPDAFGSTLDRELGFSAADWDRRLAGPEGATFLAETGCGEPVGLVGVKAWPDDPDVPELVSMWVEPATRGTGVADALVQASVAWARTATTADRLVLWVAVGNDRALAAYRRLGFAETGERQPMPDRSILELQMARALL